jgi:hypothetical protein
MQLVPTVEQDRIYGRQRGSECPIVHDKQDQMYPARPNGISARPNGISAPRRQSAETYRIRLVLFDTNKRMFGPYLALVSVGRRSHTQSQRLKKTAQGHGRPIHVCAPTSATRMPDCSHRSDRLCYCTLPLSWQGVPDGRRCSRHRRRLCRICCQANGGGG